MKKIIILLLFPISLMAHQDREFVSNIDNITLRFTTGYYTEEIQNSKFIAEYASLLSKELGYTKEIFIDLKHDYINWRIPNNFISVNNCNKEFWFHDTTETDSTNKDRIIIRSIKNKFNIAEILKLVEFAIQNEKMVKDSSLFRSFLRYNKENDDMNYEYIPTPVPVWDYALDDYVLDIDSSIIHKDYPNRSNEIVYNVERSISLKTICEILSRKQSQTINQILNIRLTKSNRRNKKDTLFSYYTQNNKYHVTYLDNDSSFYLASFDNIHRLITINKHEIFVFTSQNEFQNIISSYIKRSAYTTPHNIRVSKKFYIDDEYYYYLDVKRIEHDTYLIFQHNEGRKISLYFFDEKIIQNFHEILDKLKISK